MYQEGTVMRICVDHQRRDSSSTRGVDLLARDRMTGAVDVAQPAARYTLWIEYRVARERADADAGSPMHTQPANGDPATAERTEAAVHWPRR
jgi:hypothetical protein